MQKVDIFEYVKCMAALIRSEERKQCTELRLQLVHFEVLDYLSHSDRYTDTPAATASYFGMTRGTVSQSLIVLEKKGYIEKHKDETDKRIVHVHLLPSGLAILKKTRRTTLFNKAALVLKKSKPYPVQQQIFEQTLNALQKATQSQSFKSATNRFLDSQKKTSIFELIGYMSAIIRSEERKRCTELKLQMVHFQVLEYLSICNKYSDTPAAIANYLGMTRGTVSQTLIILENKEFVQKTRDQLDKRVYHIQLLSKGLNSLKTATPTALFNKAEKILRNDLSATEDIAAESIFIEALTSLQKANNSHSFGLCKTCKNFSKKPKAFFCELTQENLNLNDSEKICLEHIPL